MRIHSLTLGLATAAALSGCLNVPAVEHASPAAPPALQAWIGYPIGSSRVFPMFVNREAYVALFEIVPGRGVSMVYPVSGAQVRASDAHYADLSVQLGRSFYYSDPFGHSAYQPRYYYMVASVAPLNLTRLRSSLGATRKVLGAMYASYRPYDVVDRLTELVVPMQPDEDWTTDILVDWPMAAPPRYASGSSRLVTCSNGRVLVVPLGYPYFGCPGDPKTEAQSDSSKRPPADSLGDSVRQRQPEARPARPRPELSKARDVAERRRAVAGARPPGARARDVTPTPSRDTRDRYDPGGRDLTTSGAPSRSADNGARTRETTRETPSRGAESSTPRSEPRAPSRGSEGSRKNP
jgi:hypothetical protein